MKSFPIDALFEVLAQKQGFQIPVYGVIQIFCKGYHERYGTVIAKEWPFRLSSEELVQQFDLTYHAPHMEGQTWSGWTSEKGPYDE